MLFPLCPLLPPPVPQLLFLAWQIPSCPQESSLPGTHFIPFFLPCLGCMVFLCVPRAPHPHLHHLFFCLFIT